MDSRWGTAMWPPSLAGRLLLSALIGMLAAGVAAAAIFVSFACLRDTNYLIDATLEDELDSLEEGVQVDGNGRLAFRPQWSSDSYDALRKDTAFRIIDADGTTLFSSLDGPALQALERMPVGARTLDVDDAGLPVRLQVRERQVVRSGARYGLQVARSDRMVERLAGYARQLYLSATAVAVLVALSIFAVVVCITVRRAVVPLRQASAIASRIGPRALSARLHVDGIPSEMAPLIDALNSALERLEQGFNVQQDFLAMAAHELKTPLTLLRAEVELGGEMNKEAMLRETQLMARQVNQLLHLAEVSEGRNYRFSKRSLWAMSADAVDYLNRLADRVGVSLHVEHLGPDRLVDADEGAVFVLLKNLLENAISHSPRGGVVTLEVTPGGFAVVDQGAGVDPGDREHVFKRFWRASSATDGAGLGLAIVREICLAHRWAVWVEDAQGGGARFVVAIPDTAPQDA
ncbi:HAMP domain-containing sensor histidine kinase [Stenotrophomonas sp. NLF4-10]|uniref:sensor histidine kinase n=1 Tax=Stenotrophomonas sp. NLF4-10 TaxID=2918754 RepID=UPI001EFA6B59|nr:HAMP domain-containing sensor histidine kinase [Stenotrophomonas sp. NLF4-10]MCG8277475.1 HAMP domain-containing histidine kinase [Stenotrophomonas sp. NLF4-10]